MMHRGLRRASLFVFCCALATLCAAAHRLRPGGGVNGFLRTQVLLEAWSVPFEPDAGSFIVYLSPSQQLPLSRRLLSRFAILESRLALVSLECEPCKADSARLHTFRGLEHTTIARLEAIATWECKLLAVGWVGCALAKPVSDAELASVRLEPTVISVSLSCASGFRLDSKYVSNLLTHGRSNSTLRLPPASDSTNLTGDGVIVAVVDTGVDYGHCAFDGDWEVDSSSLSILNVSRKKVIQYLNFADGADEFAGHGTFTAGLAAGFIADRTLPAYQFSGLATGAKIIAVDVFDKSGTLRVASLLDYYEAAYASGARVFTESWGSPLNVYSSFARQIDEFVWKRRDAIVVRSAGNNDRRLNSECNSKNAIAVGATNHVYLSYAEYSSSGLAPISPEIRCAQIPSQCAAALAGEFTAENICKSTADPRCIKNDTAVGLDTAEARLADQWTVASFSSYGPTNDGRVRPHFVAPGVSVVGPVARPERNESSCLLTQHDFTTAWGTSIATPSVAGFAALVIQMLSSSMPELVPASLVKTVMISASRFPVDLYGQAPSNAYGYGVPIASEILLDNILILSAENITLKSFESYRWCFALSQEVNVTFVMAWTDFPAPVEAENPLMNPLSFHLRDDKNESSLFSYKSTTNDLLFRYTLPDSRSLSLVVSADALGGGRQEFSLIIVGDSIGSFFEFQKCDPWTCSGHETVPCDVLHGTGIQFCKNSKRMGPCEVTSCDFGYFISRPGSCNSPLLLWQITLIASAFGLLLLCLVTALFVVGKCLSAIFPSTPTLEVTSTSIGWRLWSQLMDTPSLFLYFIAAVLSIVSNVVDLVQPLFVGVLIGEATSTFSWNELSQEYIVGVVACSAIALGSDQVGSFLRELGPNPRTMRHIENRMTAALAKLNFRWFERELRSRNRSMMSWFTGVTIHPARFVGSYDVLFRLIPTITIKLFVPLVLIGVIGWPLLVIIVGLFPLYLVALFVSSRLVSWSRNLTLREECLLVDTANDLFSMFERWYTLSGIVRLKSRCHREISKFRRADIQSACVDVVSYLLSQSLTVVTPAAVFWVCIVLTNQAIISIGGFVMLILYAARLGGGADAVQSAAVVFAAAGPTNRTFRLLMDSNDVDKDDESHFPASISATIQFSNVQLTRGDHLVFRDLNLSVRHGLTSVLGSSGSGKSSLLLLAIRCALPERGVVSLGEQDILTLNRAEITSAVTLLRQHPKFPSGNSLRGLTRLLVPSHDEKRAEAALSRSLVQSWLSRLFDPDSYWDQTIPQTISGGQTKSLELYFGLLADSSIVLADEIASDFDEQSANNAYGILLEWAAALKLVLHVTHDQRLVHKFGGGRILVAKEGVVRDASIEAT